MYELKTVAYACTYCSYPVTYLDGTSLIKCSRNVNIMRGLSAGRVWSDSILCNLGKEGKYFR
jgi:coenzyme F420-reducing hydrogenase delta subunit